MTQTGREYANALFALARDEGVDDAVMDGLKLVGETWTREGGLVRFLNSRSVSKAEKSAALEACYGAYVHVYVLNVLKILSHKCAAQLVPEVCAAYKSEYNAHYGILPVRAVTPRPLNDAQLARLSEKLTALTGKQIELANDTDERLLAGVRLEYDKYMTDDTVRRRLEDMRALLTEKPM